MSWRRERVFSVVLSVSNAVTRFMSKQYLRQPGFEDIIIGSGISASSEEYVAKASKLSALAVVLSALVTGIYMYTLSGRPILSLAGCLIIALAAVLPLTYGVSLAVPILAYKSRGEVIEARFTLFASLASLTAASERDVLKILEVLYCNYQDVLKDFMVELSMIVSLVRLGFPLHEALTRAARVTPSPTLKEVLLGLSEAVRIGSGPLELMSSMTGRYLDRYPLKVESVVNELGVTLEIYLAVALLVPVLVGSLGALLVFSPMGGLTFELVVFMLSYVLVPVSSLASLVAVDAIVSKVVI
ncbi:MAG: type II secretion system F family protein [Zestosphaera sp.]